MVELRERPCIACGKPNATGGLQCDECVSGPRPTLPVAERIAQARRQVVSTPEAVKSATLRALLFPPVLVQPVDGEDVPPPAERAPRMNTTERRYRDTFLGPAQASGEIVTVLEQAVKFRLADRTWYTPDFIALLPAGAWWCIEVKGGGPIRDDAAVKFKVAAEAYPWWRWTMAQWKGGEWKVLRDYPAVS